MINLKEEHSKFVKLYSFSSGATSPTNIKLVEEMISHLDEELFKNPNSKFLDPCAGTGTFGVVLYDKLLKYHDSKWIFENMIFMVDTSRVNCDILKKLGFVNVYNDDFLKINFDMKFDVILGNPPFQETHEDGRSKKNALRLWAKFVIYIFTNDMIKKDGYLTFVTPSGWAGSSSQVFESLIDKQLIYANFSSDVSKSFIGVGGSMVFTTFLVQNTKKNTIPKIKFDEGIVEIDLMKMPITPIKSSNMYDFTILNKMIESDICGLPWKRYDDKNRDIDGLSILMSRSKSENNNADFTHNLDDRSGFWLYGDEEFLNNILNNINLPIYKHFRWVVRSGMAIANNITTLPIPTHLLTTDSFCELFNLDESESDYVRGL